MTFDAAPLLQAVPLGDRALLVKVASDGLTEDSFNRVYSVLHRLQIAQLAGVTELVPTIEAVTVYFDPLLVTVGQLIAQLKSQLQLDDFATPSPSRLVNLPVCYGGGYGIDLPAVAEATGHSPDEVIRIHSSREYRVHMLGFMPGFAYLGGLSPRIAVPRLETPRLKIAAGSVGIAGQQTGIYPFESPGGWQLIGRTPLPLFRASINPPTLLQPGDMVRFKSVDEPTFDHLFRLHHR